MPAIPAPIPPLNGIVQPSASLTTVLGRSLRFFAPGVGFMRLGYCNYTSLDPNPHTVAAIVTKEFLDYTKSRGNDLITPRLEHGFWGLREGCRWCVGIQRWLEAFKAKEEFGDAVVPRYLCVYSLGAILTLTLRVVLEATALQTLNEVRMEDLEKFSVEDGPLTELFPFSSR
jgi:uncharacterized protein